MLELSEEWSCPPWEIFNNMTEYWFEWYMAKRKAKEQGEKFLKQKEKSEAKLKEALRKHGR